MLAQLAQLRAVLRTSDYFFTRARFFSLSRCFRRHRQRRGRRFFFFLFVVVVVPVHPHIRIRKLYCDSRKRRKTLPIPSASPSPSPIYDFFVIFTPFQAFLLFFPGLIQHFAMCSNATSCCWLFNEQWSEIMWANET